MTAEIIDTTGQPRKDEDIREAIKVIEKQILTGILKLPPELAVQLMTIRQSLQELLEIRNKCKT